MAALGQRRRPKMRRRTASVAWRIRTSSDDERFRPGSVDRVGNKAIDAARDAQLARWSRDRLLRRDDGA